MSHSHIAPVLHLVGASQAGPSAAEDRPWRWRNCREVTLGVQIRLFPWQWFITAEWLAETFTASGLVQFGPLVLTFWADVGNNSTGNWRDRFGLAERTAWERAE